ncbi:MAG: NACHT domain-containing protein [Bacteroidota bacterium]
MRGFRLESYLQEYKLLSLIHPRDAHKDLLREYFYSFGSKVFCEDNGHREQHLMQAFLYVLQNVDTCIFQTEQDVKLLVDLLVKLMNKIDGKGNLFNEATYPSHAPVLEAIYELLRIIRTLDNTPWSRRKDGRQRSDNLYNSLKDKLRVITRDSQSYRIHYHAHLLKQALAQYEEPLSTLDRIEVGMQGTLTLLRFLASFADLRGACEGVLQTASFSMDVFEKINRSLDVGTEAYSGIREACTYFKEAFGRHSTQRPYYKHHQALSLFSTLALGEKDNDTACNYCQDFFEYVDRIKNSSPSLNLSAKDTKALKYFSIRQLTLLAIHGCDAVREKTVDKLDELGKLWSRNRAMDRDIMSELLDGLALVHNQRKDSYNLASQQSRGILEGLVGHAPFWIGGYGTLQDKLRAMFRSEAGKSPQLGAMFRAVISHREENRHTEPSIREDLKRAYREKFQSLPSFLELENYGSINNVDFHISRNQSESVKVVLKDDNPEDLLQETRVPVELAGLEALLTFDSSKILIVGEPGIGKTTLVRKLAYDWSVGKWGTRFKTVYLLPASTLREEQENLVAAIAKVCISTQHRDDLNHVCHMVEESLRDTRTLLILDGIDEAHDLNDSLFRGIKRYNCKILLTSRPSCETSRGLDFDQKVDHLGLKDDTLEKYVRDFFDSCDMPQAIDSFLESVKGDYDLWVMAKVPVNLKIFCLLWRERDTIAEMFRTNQALPACLPSLYRYFSEYIKRYPIPSGQAVTEALFQELERIALEVLQDGKSRFESASDLSALESSILLQEESQYQFIHLMLQNHFAGRCLARGFLGNTPEAQNIISGGEKYFPHYQSAFSFLAGEVSRYMYEEVSPNDTPGTSNQYIYELLRLTNKGPRDHAGVNHLLLQLRIINEWLTLTDSDTIERYFSDLEQEFKVGVSLKKKLSAILYQPSERVGDLGLLINTLKTSRAVLYKYGEEILKSFQKALSRSDSMICHTASKALGELGRVASASFLNTTFTLLSKKFREQGISFLVRYTIADVLVKLYQQSFYLPQDFRDQVWELLADALSSGDKKIVIPTKHVLRQYVLRQFPMQELVDMYWIVRESRPDFVQFIRLYVREEKLTCNSEVSNEVPGQLRLSFYTMHDGKEIASYTGSGEDVQAFESLISVEDSGYIDSDEE